MLKSGSYTNVKIHTSELDERLILDDVEQEGSINPRACISLQHVAEYEAAIIAYLHNDQEFSEVWGQRPQAVATGEETEMGGEKYLLTSGYHTITALKNVIAKVENEPDTKDESEDGTVFKLGDIDINFDVIIQVIKPKKGVDYKDLARYHASFANVHGQPLKSGEKSKAAYNALSTMNLSKSENDDSLLPFINDRKLAAMMGISKTTVYDQRQILNQERFGVVNDTPAPATTASTETSTESVASEIENLDANTPATPAENTSAAPVELGDVNAKETESTPSGTEGIDLGLNPETEEDDDDEIFTAEEKEEILKQAKELFSGGDIIKLQTVVKFRETVDFILTLNADSLSKAYSDVGGQIKTAKDTYSKIAAAGDGKEDPAYIKGVSELLTLFQIVMGCIADENDQRA